LSPKTFSQRIKILFDKIGAFWLWHLTGNVAILGVVDDCGGDFKEYCFRENMPQRVADLKKNLDVKSCEYIDLCVERMLYVHNLKKRWGITLVKPQHFLNAEEMEWRAEWKRRYPEIRKKYKLPVRSHIPDVFMFHHGLLHLPKKVQEYLQEKDVIDGGAYVGDSMLMLQDYAPRKVYSFDIFDTHKAIYEKTMKLNHILPEKAELIFKGLGEKNEKIFINNEKIYGIAASLYNTATENEGDCMEITTIDSFTSERNLKIGLIKIDVEGYDAAAVRGSVETIRRDRPVLSIAIYHNPEEFFELKPYLESLNLNYRYLIRHLTPPCFDVEWSHDSWWVRHIEPFVDTYLLAYPAELDEADTL